MKAALFSGVCTALVTPFLNGKVNYPMMEQLIRRQVEAGIHAIVLCGTTGEAPTLTDTEKLAMIHRAKQYIGDECMIIAGTGSNATAHAIELSCAAEEAGADALLVVSPYYNKATPEGLFLHYSSIAANVHIPVILYNVPSRTGLDMPVEVYARLAEISGIAGVKEASSDISKTIRIREACPDHFAIWSGNDEHTVPAMALGGYGVISVVANLYPEKMKEMTDAAISGDYASAAAIQLQLNGITRLLFSEVNPIPVKAAMRMMGFDCGECRLPLTAPSNALSRKLKAALA